MKKLLVIMILAGLPLAAHAQDALTAIKNTIGNLVVENANLTGQLTAAAAENKKLVGEIAELKAQIEKAKPKEAQPAEPKKEPDGAPQK